MKKTILYSLLPVFFLLVISGCKKEKKERIFAQNTIVYDASLPGNQAMAKYLADCNTNYFKHPKNRFASTTRAEDMLAKPAPKESKKFVEWKKAIGDEWLFTGATEKAIASYDEALKKASDEKIKGDIIKETTFMKAVAYMRLGEQKNCCLLYTSPSPRDRTRSRMPSSA